MSSRIYAYFFSGEQIMDTSNLVSIFEKRKFEFEEVIYLPEIVDDKEHFEYCESRNLNDAKELNSLLNTKCNFLIECGSEEFALSFSVATTYPNPFLTISWSTRSFKLAAPEKRQNLLDALLELARVSASKFVFFVRDVPDYFQDNFIEEKGVFLLDVFNSCGNPYEILNIWADPKNMEGLQSEASYSQKSKLNEYFSNYVPEQWV